MIATVVISSITFVAIIISLFLFPKIRIGKISISTYWLIALMGATILLIFSLSPIKEVYQELTANSKINPIKILVLFFSMTLISTLLDEFGLFKFLASVATKRVKNQYGLFFILYGLVAILTIFTSNDIVILTFTPFICFFCRRANINPLPYLVSEFAAANTLSLLLIIGNPTNIFLATSANINFIDYVKVMALPTIAAGIVELGILFLLFNRKLKEKIRVIDLKTALIENKPMLIVGVIHLFVCLVFLVLASYINIEMWLVSLVCAVSLLLATILIALITKKNWNYLSSGFKRLPYALIPFFLSMFVIVVAFNYQGISLEIARLLGEKGTIWVYGYSSFVTSNVINNIPMSILYSGLSSNLEGVKYLQAIYASIVGSNLGAFLTPMGALAGIMFLNLINKYEIKFSFIDFVKYGAIIALPTISTALLILFIVFRF